jgi:hypothetical protein
VLARRTPLRADPEQTRAWQQRSRRRLPVRSARRAAEASERRKVVREVIARDGGCRGLEAFPDVACWGPLAAHEVLPRGRGGDYLDPDAAVALCAAHHSHCHDHPLEAKAAGLLV